MTINKDNVTVHLDIQSHQTIQWPIAFSVFVEHGFVVSKGHTSIKKTVDNKSDMNITYKQNPPKNNFDKYIDNYYCLCFRRYVTVYVFLKIFLRNTHRAHAEYDWSVYLLTFCLICKFHWFWRSNRNLFRDRRVKILACSLKRSVTLFEKW